MYSFVTFTGLISLYYSRISQIIMKWRSSFVPPLRRVGSKSSFSPQASFGAPAAASASFMPVAPLHWSSSLPSLQSHRLVVATATTAITQPSPFVGFVYLFLSFVAGGIFFSSLLAGATTFFAVGQSNISRLWSLVKTVIHQVWKVFVVGLNEARLALRMDGKWNPGRAWQVLKTKLGETRKAAEEGMNAIKAEKNFYAGAVGQPGLITFQYFLDRLMPFALASQMENSLRDSLKGVKNELIQTIKLKEFDLGGVTPTLLEARNYELGRDALAFDVDIKWESAVYVKMTVTTRRIGLNVPVTVRNATFVGTARIEMTPLTKEPPGWGAILVSLASVPKIGLRLDAVGGDLTKIPWLKKEITKTLQKAIEDQLLWPKRLVLPSVTVPPNCKTVMSRSELNQLSDSDPLLRAERALEQQAVLKDHIYSLKPNVTELPSNLQVSVGDEDEINPLNGKAATNTTAVSEKNIISIFHRGKEGNPFTNFFMRKTHNDVSSTPVDHYKNGTIISDSHANGLEEPRKEEKGKKKRW